MNSQYPHRHPWVIACIVALTMQFWPHTAHSRQASGLPALQPSAPRSPARDVPGWPQPTLPAERVSAGAEPMAMLPAEQHLGEFSEADLAFITRAAMLGRAQGIYAKVALRRGKSAEVRKVAQKLAAFHRKSRTELANVVQPHGVVLPSGIDSAHQWLRAHLMETDDKAFDRVYLKSQIEEHASAVRIFRDQVNHGKSAQLRAWARGVLDGLEAHRQILESLYAPDPMS